MQKFKIESNELELEYIGIYSNINGLEGTFVKSYPDGWISLLVTHEVNGCEFTNEFDLPKYMCKPVE